LQRPGEFVDQGLKPLVDGEECFLIHAVL
jgi:hypothetical protein